MKAVRRAPPNGGGWYGIPAAPSMGPSPSSQDHFTLRFQTGFNRSDGETRTRSGRPAASTEPTDCRDGTDESAPAHRKRMLGQREMALPRHRPVHGAERAASPGGGTPECTLGATHSRPARFTLPIAGVPPRFMHRTRAAGAPAATAPYSGILPGIRHVTSFRATTSPGGRATERWRTASKRSTAAATETFRLSTGSRNGIETIRWHFLRVS